MIFFLYYLCKNTFSNGVTSILLYRPSSPIEVPFKKAKDKGLGFFGTMFTGLLSTQEKPLGNSIGLLLCENSRFYCINGAFSVVLQQPRWPGRGTAPVPCHHSDPPSDTKI